MKILKTLTVLISMVGVFGSSEAPAKDGQGTIEEIINCGTGQTGNPSWKQYLLFKLSDGNWFGIYADYGGSAASDYDSNVATSMVLMAFSSKLPLKIRFNHHIGTYCGESVAMFWANKDDYMKIAR